jgi:hypothetical protein
LPIAAELSLIPRQTIFAIPIFDFKNAWMDIRFQRAAPSFPGGWLPNSNLTDPQASTSTTSTITTTTSGNNPVLSGYFWIYLGIALGLTSLTFLLFFSVVRYGREKTPNPDRWPGEIRTILTDEVFTQEMQVKEAENAVSCDDVTRGDYVSSQLYSVLKWLRSWACFRQPEKA